MSQVSHALWQHHGIQTTTTSTTTKEQLRKKTEYLIVDEFCEKETKKTKIFDGLDQRTSWLFENKIEYQTHDKFCQVNEIGKSQSETNETRRNSLLFEERRSNKLNGITKKRIDSVNKEGSENKLLNERSFLNELDNVNNIFDTNKNVIKICDENEFVGGTRDKIIIDRSSKRNTKYNKIFIDSRNSNDELTNKDKTFNVDKNANKFMFNKRHVKKCIKNDFNKKRDTQTHSLKAYYKRLVNKEEKQRRLEKQERSLQKFENLSKEWRFWHKKTGTVARRKHERRWNLHSLLISLLVLNLVGVSYADDGSGFSSGITARMIASFLGYGHSCSVGGVSRACTLTVTCWLRGGTALRGCGGWLFSCCTARDYGTSISSSEWKYKVSPPKLRQVPHRAVIANNVFRRRVDDDVSQMECGMPSSSIFQKRIIGGRQARFAEFPWQAHVRISEFQCGGVLVSRWFVATAAHCVSRAPVRDIVVWLGAVDTSDTQPATKLGITQKILHPLFQFRMTQPDRYDIALLKFTRPITYSNYILPICLPDYDLELRGRSGVIAGWGKTDASSGHTGTNILRSATVPILSKEQCINWHQSKQISVEIHSEMICAGHSDGHQDACLGDSGGPLIVLDSGRYYLVGITSAGFGCGVDHQPGIYHNVKITADWIRHVIVNTYHYIDGMNRIN